MNIFDKRPLSLILCIWLGGFVFFSTGKPVTRAITLIVSLFLLVTYLLLRIRNVKKPILLASTIALLTSIIASQIVFGFIYNPTRDFPGESVVSGSVSNISYGTYSSSIVLKTKTVNDESYRGRLVVFRTSNARARDVSIGDTVTVTGVFYDFENTEEFDTQSYYFADSVCAEISDITSISVERCEKEQLSSKFATMREFLRRRIVMSSNADSGNIAAALLFGERGALPDQTRLNFTRIGISHLLALSGLHLTILCIGLFALLNLFRINKKLRYAISILFVILYIAFTGFSVSVLRAGIMLIVAYTLFLIAKTHDSITSLAISAFVICVISPFSIYDVSLWLSAFATLGLLVLYEALPKATESVSLIKSVGKYFLYSILSSIFAITATMLISTFTFGTISIIAPISNLIFSLFAEILMCLGSITLIFGKFIPIRKLMIPIANAMNTLADRLSEPRWVYVSTDYVFLKMLIIILTVAFIVFVIANVKRKRAYLLLLASFFIAVCVSAVVASEVTYSDSDLIYASKNRSDMILIKSESEVCLINSAQFNKNSASNVKRLLQEENITYLDKYVVTSYAWSVSDDVCTILSSVKTDEVYLPTPRSSDEADICEILYARISEFDTNLIIYNDEDPINSGAYTIHRDYASLYGEGNLCAIRIYDESHIYTYLSSGMTLCEDYPVQDNLTTSDAVIYGGYGTKIKDDFFINYFYEKNKKIILSTENIIFDSHYYSKYKENGCEIYTHPYKISILLDN